MQFDKQSKTFALSPRDLAVMQEAKADFFEIIRARPKHPGLPPLWSKLPYLMLYHRKQETSRYFWKEYREFNELLATRDSHYRRSRIPKSSGGTRDLLVPDSRLRLHQQFILKNILYKIPVSKHACAYHKFRGLTDLAKPHIGHETLIHMDIQDFFSGISEQMVFEALQEEAGYGKTAAGYLSRLCCYKRYLPQGACTSPALSNICFKCCDDALAALAAKHGLAYTRYSDDLFFSGNGVDARTVIREATEILNSHGFRVHTRKTRVLGQHQAQKVTAIVVNEKMQVSRSYRRQLRQEIYYLQRFGARSEAAIAAGDYESYLYQLLGRVSFVLYVDPENEEFRAARKLLGGIFREVCDKRIPVFAALGRD